MIQSNVSRMVFFLFAITSTLTYQAVADPYKPGDKIVVIQRAPIFFEGRADDVGFPGWIYEVLSVEGDRLWVASKTPGWIDRQYVIPLDRASAYFSSRIKLHPNDGEAIRARALLLMEEGKLDAAIDDFSAMIRNEPNVSMTWNDRGRAYMRKGDLDRAISEFNHAIEIDSQWPVYYTNRGIAWNRKGDYSKAILDWKAAIGAPKFSLALSTAGPTVCHMSRQAMPKRAGGDQLCNDRLRTFGVEGSAGRRDPCRCLRGVGKIRCRRHMAKPGK